MTANPSSHLPPPHQTPERGQFLRIEKYADRAPRGKTGGNNIHKIAAEIMRIDGYCPHVSNPLAPQLVYGVEPRVAATLSSEWSKRQTETYLHKPSGKYLTRKRRMDKACALAGVISTPPEWLAGPNWERFVQCSIGWLKQKFTEQRLASVVSHHDERNLHLHFWVIPLESESIHSIHPGEGAIETVGRNAPRVLRDAAYKKAMAQLLDEFHDQVGDKFGLLRQTKSGNRYSRQDWLRRRWLKEEREKERLIEIEKDGVELSNLVKKRISGKASSLVLPATDEKAVQVAGPQISGKQALQHLSTVETRISSSDQEILIDGGFLRSSRNGQQAANDLTAQRAFLNTEWNTPLFLRERSHPETPQEVCEAKALI